MLSQPSTLLHIQTFHWNNDRHRDAHIQYYIALDLLLVIDGTCKCKNDRAAVSEKALCHQNDISDSSPNSLVIIQLPLNNSKLGRCPNVT